MSGLESALEIVSKKRWNGVAKALKVDPNKFCHMIKDELAFGSRAMLVKAGWRTEMEKAAGRRWERR